MRRWDLGLGDPLSLTLAADFRLGGVDYLNDQVWELELGWGEPPALALRTTFGLRARSMRLFPRFGEGRTILHDPAQFARPPRLRVFYPNFLELEFAPLDGLDVTAEYWAARSQVMAGRFLLVNRRDQERVIRLELCALLSPLDGQAFFPAQSQMVNVITGLTGGLAPLLYMTGGPVALFTPYPALMVELTLAPGASRRITWALAALSASGPSFELARKTVARPWDAERARIELMAQSQMVDIETGNLDWDAAFAFTQTTALRSFFPAGGGLPHPSFVLAREPDHGYSPRQDGSDYPPSWAGQTPLTAYYLSSLLPGASQWTYGVLRNFLAVQDESGAIDLRPGLAGQRARLQATPLLAALAWQIYHATNDESFLAEVFPGLLKAFWQWFSPEHDRNRDARPEWEHPMQTGWEENPLFDVWNPWSQGVAIDAVESPALYAMLVREAACLIWMAEKLGRSQEVVLVRHQAELLAQAVSEMWDQAEALYRYRDVQTHYTPGGQIFVRGRGSGVRKVKQELDPPSRLLVEVFTERPMARRPVVRLAEYVTKEPVEVIEPEQFRWRSGGLTATTQRVYSRLGRVDVFGLEKRDRIMVRAVNLTAQDHTLLLPLWAGIPDDDRARHLLERTLLDPKRFHKPFGAPALASCSNDEADEVCSSVHLPLNHLIGEGLLAYGFRREAAQLVQRIMAAVIQTLKERRAFAERYHAETAAPLGERNTVTGLAPLGLFLQTLGVTIYSAAQVRLEGQNPFPWPVTLRYRGLTVHRQAEHTEVVFPNGKSVVISDPRPCLITMSHESQRPREAIRDLG